MAMSGPTDHCCREVDAQIVDFCGWMPSRDVVEECAVAATKIVEREWHGKIQSPKELNKPHLLCRLTSPVDPAWRRPEPGHLVRVVGVYAAEYVRKSVA